MACSGSMVQIHSRLILFFDTVCFDETVYCQVIQNQTFWM